MSTKPINIRIPKKILQPFRDYAELTGIPYQTLINTALAKQCPEIQREIIRLSQEPQTV